MKKSLLLFGFMLLAGLALAANPCPVGPTGEFTTIQAAITSWCAGGTNYGATPPFVVNIDPSVEYDEMITLDDARPTGNIRGDLVLQSATPGTKVIVKLRYDTGTLPAQAAGARDGLWVHQGAYDITFKDLLFMPSPTATVVDDDLVKCDENNNTTSTIANTFTFDGCIFTDGYTSGTARVPKVKSKADLLAMTFPADMTAFTPAGSMGAGDDLLKFWGDATPILERMNLLVKDCVFFTKNGRCFEGYCNGTTETLTIQDSLFAMGAASYVITARPYNDNTFVNILGTLDPRQGDLTKCTAVLCCYAHPYYVSGGGSLPLGDLTMKNAMADMSNTGAPASTVRLLSGGAEGKLIEDCIFRIEGKPGSIVDYCMTKDSIYNRVTFHRPWTVATPIPPLVVDNFFYLGSGSDPYGIKLTDCVVSGALTTAIKADPSPTPTATPTPVAPGPPSWDVGGFIMNNCAIATVGPDAISTLGSPPAQLITYNNCKFVDPIYLSKDRKLETFLDTSNPALANAGSDITGIGGGAHYRGPDASDNLQNIFKSFGDCEGDIFIDSSDRAGTPTDLTMLDDQNPVRGVIGNAQFCSQIAVGSRLEGLSAICATNFTGSDQIFTMYYKVPPSTPSYPRFALKRNQTVTPPQEGTGDAARVLWTNPNFTCDNQWHLFTPVVNTLVWTPGDTASLFVNNYFPYCANFYLDEIVFDDPDADSSSVQDWGLF